MRGRGVMIGVLTFLVFIGDVLEGGGFVFRGWGVCLALAGEWRRWWFAGKVWWAIYSLVLEGWMNKGMKEGSEQCCFGALGIACLYKYCRLYLTSPINRLTYFNCKSNTSLAVLEV